MNSFVKNLDIAQKGVWFPIIFGAAVLLILILIPKKLTFREIYITFGIVGFVTLVTDIYFMASWIDIFDLGDPAINGIADITIYAIIPSALAIIYLNYLRYDKKWTYAILFTLVSFIFEFILVKVGYMKLKGWRSWFSIPVYIIVYGVWLPWHLKLIQKTAKET